MSRRNSRRTVDQLKAAIAAHRQRAAGDTEPANRHAALLEQRIEQLEEQIGSIAKEQRALVWAVIGTVVAAALAQIVGG